MSRDGSDKREKGAEESSDPLSEQPDLEEELTRIRAQLESIEQEVDARSVPRKSLERDLKRYVRQRVRRGHAHGWGPYIVLLYGTAMTIAAFYYLSSGWAVLAMLVIWTSTIGVFFLMILVGASISILNIPGRIRDRIEQRFS